MIRAFLFDYDGVITKGVNNEWVAGRLARNLGISIEAASPWMKDIWPAFLRGTISEDEVWRQIEKKYGKPILPEQRDVWFAWEELEPIPEMLELVRSLKADRHVVGVLSNVFSVNKEVIKSHGGYDVFDLVVTSCDLGLKKPEPEIFRAALRELGDIKPEEVVFLDDRETNTAAAEELGMKGVHVTNQYNAIHDVRVILATQKLNKGGVIHE